MTKILWWHTFDEFKKMADPDYDWEQHHTKQLLDLRNNLRSNMMIDLTSPNLRDENYFETLSIVKKKLYEVLKTREHVPNKAELKELRKKKMKERQNR